MKLNRFLTAALLIGTIFIFTSCGGGDDTHTHEWGEWETVTEATCSAKGLSKRVCSLDETHVEEKDIPQLNHTWNDGVVTTEPTATEEGVKTFTCIVCNTTRTEPVAALGGDRGGFASSEGLTYRLNGNGSSYTVTGLGTCTDEVIRIDTYKGLPVTSIGYRAFDGKASVKEVVIGASVKSIQPYAFTNCDGLVSVSVAYGCESVDFEAFSYCDSLKTVSFSDSIKKMDKNIFWNCKSLESFTIPKNIESIGDGVFESCVKLNTTEYSGARYIGTSENPYFYLYKSTSYDNEAVTVHESTVYIGDYAMANCASLTSIEIPASVRVIMRGCFWGCDALETVNLNEGLVEIGGSSFRQCRSLKAFTLPSTVETISTEAFDVPKGATVYKNACYIGTEANPHLFLVGAADKTITSFEIHPNAKYVGDYAFGECDKLKSAVLPNTVEYYGETLFIMCYELESITLPTNIKLLPNGILTACTSLKSVTVPDGVEVIDGYAFSSCSSLKTVYLPCTVKEISYDIFNGATSLTDVYFDGTLEAWGNISFNSDWADGQNGFTVHCTDGDVTVEVTESDW